MKEKTIKEKILKNQLKQHKQKYIQSKIQKIFCKHSKEKEFINPTCIELYSSDSMRLRLYGIIKLHNPKKNMTFPCFDNKRFSFRMILDDLFPSASINKAIDINLQQLKNDYD